MVKFSDFGWQQLVKDEIAYFFKAITGLDVDDAAQEARKTLSDGLQSVLSDIIIGKVPFDEERMLYWFGVGYARSCL